MVMNRQGIEVVVDPAGGIRIDAQGFSGTDCEKATAFLEKVLGTTINKAKKPQYYQAAENRRQQQVGL